MNQVAHLELFPATSPLQGYPSINKFNVTRSLSPASGSTHLFSWAERGIVRVKCLAQEQITMSLARAQTHTQSRAERTNHEATTPPSRSKNTSMLGWNDRPMRPVMDLYLSRESSDVLVLLVALCYRI